MSKTSIVVISIVVVMALIGGAFCVASLERIEAGEVGVVYSMKGGVQDEVLQQGVHSPAFSLQKYFKNFVIFCEKVVDFLEIMCYYIRELRGTPQTKGK